MSHVRVGVHVRHPDRARVTSAVEERLRKAGYERLAHPRGNERDLVTVRLRVQKSWISFAVENDEDVAAWATALGRALDAPALGAWFWDGEASWELTFANGRARPAKLSLPRDARPAADGRAAIPLRGMSSLVRADAPSGGVEILVKDEDFAFEDGACVYLSEDKVERALCRAFGLAEIFVDPLDEGEDDAESILFCPRPDSAVAKRARAEQAREDDKRRADYDARLHTVGWLAFHVDVEGKKRATDVTRVLGAVGRPLALALRDSLGPRGLSARGFELGKTDVALPSPDTKPAWKAYASALVGGKLVELARPGPVAVATIWFTLRPEGELVVGWSFRALKDPEKRVALAKCMDDVVTTSANDPRCFGALVTAQGTPMSLAQRALAYEYYRGRSALSLRHAAHRQRARAPGWRVLVPGRAAEHLPLAPPNVRLRSVGAGTLLEVDMDNPFAITAPQLDEVEAYLDASDVLARGERT